MNEKLYSTMEAAEQLDVTPLTVLHLISSGKLKAEKAGRFYVITETALEECREERERKGYRPTELAGYVLLTLQSMGKSEEETAEIMRALEKTLKERTKKEARKSLEPDYLSGCNHFSASKK